MRFWFTALLALSGCTQEAPNPATTEPEPHALPHDNTSPLETPKIATTPPEKDPSDQYGAKKAHCELSNNDGTGGQVLTKEPCLVREDEMGTGGFSITGVGDTNILENISIISVAVIGAGRAEVRGLTTFGINSRWGMARQSKSAPECWKGSDFEICVRSTQTLKSPD